jgi:hypothetical protein
MSYGEEEPFPREHYPAIVERVVREQVCDGNADCDDGFDEPCPEEYLCPTTGDRRLSVLRQRRGVYGL